MSKKNKTPKPCFPNSDQDFNDRAVHLQNNIYGSDKGKLRLAVLKRDLQEFVPLEKKISVLDAGCGTGLMSAWMAERGHAVSAYDSSAVMVSETQKKIEHYPQSFCLESPIKEIPSDDTFQLVMCHAVLEWVENQEELLEKLSSHVAPDGYLSLMFYNAWSREMAQMIYGNFAYIDKGYQVRQRVKLSPHRPAYPHVVEAQLKKYGLEPVVRSGIRIFYDVMRNQEHHKTLSDDIIRHELRVSREYPYWQMGRYVHYLFKAC